MKIQPVGNYYRPNYTYSSKPVQTNSLTYADKTLYKAQESKPCPVNFTSLQTSAIEYAKAIPLEERLASLFNIMKSGDVILSSKSLREAQKSLKTIVANFDNVLKRFIFVEDESLGGSLVFMRNKADELEVLNPNKSEIQLSNILSNNGEKYSMKQNESFYVVPGDIITLNGKNVEIKEDSKVNLAPYRPLFSSIFDLTNEVKPSIKNLNLKSISTLIKAEGVKGKASSFSDVGGQDKVINELKKGILYPVKYPEAYENSIVNHGFVLYGPPGTGKTLLAQALANESDANFIKLNGLEMESKWVGESEENWRKLFDTARESQPSIIFIDEFDAIAKKRGGIDVYGDKVVNQLLTLMSDVEKNGDDIFVVTATNKLNLLDDAIIRSGRFGKHIEVKAPDNIDGILQIFDIHTKSKPISKDLDKDALAKTLLNKHATGADIAHIVNSAHENAFERSGIYRKMENGTFTKADIDNLQINQEDFDKAIETFEAKTTNKNQRNPIGYAVNRN